MELIAIDENMHEIGVLVVDTDIEIGKSDSLNNFEITAMPIDAAGFYIEGTEYGGFFEYTSETSGNAKITMKGWTWRGLLTQDIIIPPEGSDYKIVSGDANAIIKELLANVLGGFFTFRKRRADARSQATSSRCTSMCWTGSTGCSRNTDTGCRSMRKRRQRACR